MSSHSMLLLFGLLLGCSGVLGPPAPETPTTTETTETTETTAPSTPPAPVEPMDLLPPVPSYTSNTPDTTASPEAIAATQDAFRVHLLRDVVPASTLFENCREDARSRGVPADGSLQDWLDHLGETYDNEYRWDRCKVCSGARLPAHGTATALFQALIDQNEVSNGACYRHDRSVGVCTFQFSPPVQESDTFVVDLLFDAEGRPIPETCYYSIEPY